jgi:small subunit ribosomal protein S16
MLAIRMQRTGRRGHAQFRVVVQDSRFSPSSGRVVAYLGSYDPHTKATALDGEKASYYLEHGARPSDRVARILKTEGIKLPTWVKVSDPKKRDIRNPEKLRKNQPEQPKDETPEPVAEPAAKEAEAPAEESEEVVEEAPAEAVEEAPVAEETSAEEEKPAEEPEQEKKEKS